MSTPKSSAKGRDAQAKSDRASGNRDVLLRAAKAGINPTRSSSSAKQLPMLAQCVPPSNNDVEPMLRQMARQFPIYSHPFIGCKVANIQLGSTAVSWTGTTWNLATTITQGSGDQQRTGDVIRLIGVHARWRASKGSAVAPGSDSEYQVQLCYSPLAAIPIGSVFQDTGTAYSGLSPMDWDFAAVIKRLHAFQGTVDTYSPLRIHECMVRCNELINYDSGATTVATGSLVVAAISGEDPAAPTQVPLVYGNVQVFYQDV